MTVKTDLQRIGDFISKRIIKEWVNQGHKLTGKFIN